MLRDATALLLNLKWKESVDFPKYYGDFLGTRSISGKIFMKILTVVIKILGELLNP